MHRTCRGASSTCCCRIGLNGPLRAHAPPTQQRLARCLLVSGIYCIGAAEISVGSWGPLHKDQYRKVSDRGHVHGMVLCATRDRLLASAKCTARYHSPVSENVDDQAKQWPHRSQKIDIKLSAQQKNYRQLCSMVVARENLSWPTVVVKSTLQRLMHSNLAHLSGGSVVQVLAYSQVIGVIFRRHVCNELAVHEDAADVPTFSTCGRDVCCDLEPDSPDTTTPLSALCCMRITICLERSLLLRVSDTRQIGSSCERFDGCRALAGILERARRT